MASTKSKIKSLVDKAILVVVLLFISFAFTSLFSWIGRKANSSPDVLSVINNVVKTIFYVLILLGLTYKSVWSKDTFTSKKKSTGFVLVFCFIAYLIFGWINFYEEGTKLYQFLKNPPMLSEHLFKTDEKLGYAPIPNTSGLHTYHASGLNIKIPAVTDEEGHRTYQRKYEIGNDSLILFLGCSFTWADYSIAEESFAYLTASQMHSPYVNAGVSGYGLAQMYILAGQLIPQKKPKTVVVQYSPWLIDRATSAFTPTFFGTRFSPYFVNIDGKDSLVYPFYFSCLDEVPFEYYKTSKAGRLDKIAFLKDVAYPVIMKSSFQRRIFNLKKALGILPEPNEDKQGVEKYFYTYISDLCQKNNCKMVVLNLNVSYESNYTYSKFVSTVGKEVAGKVVFVDAASELCKRVKSAEEFVEMYAHKEDGVIFDGHPNYLAAKIISQQLVSSIKK